MKLICVCVWRGAEEKEGFNAEEKLGELSE